MTHVRTLIVAYKDTETDKAITFTLKVKDTDTIGALKALIQGVTGFNAADQNLIRAAIPLNDDARTVGGCNVRETVQLVMNCTVYVLYRGEKMCLTVKQPTVEGLQQAMQKKTGIKPDQLEIFLGDNLLKKEMPFTVLDLEFNDDKPFVVRMVNVKLMGPSGQSLSVYLKPNECNLRGLMDAVARKAHSTGDSFFEDPRELDIVYARKKIKDSDIKLVDGDTKTFLAFPGHQKQVPGPEPEMLSPQDTLRIARAAAKAKEAAAKAKAEAEAEAEAKAEEAAAKAKAEAEAEAEAKAEADADAEDKVAKVAFNTKLQFAYAEALLNDHNGNCDLAIQHYLASEPEPEDVPAHILEIQEQAITVYSELCNVSKEDAKESLEPFDFDLNPAIQCFLNQGRTVSPASTPRLTPGILFRIYDNLVMNLSSKFVAASSELCEIKMKLERQEFDMEDAPRPPHRLIVGACHAQVAYEYRCGANDLFGNGNRLESPIESLTDLYFFIESQTASDQKEYLALFSTMLLKRVTETQNKILTKKLEYETIKRDNEAAAIATQVESMLERLKELEAAKAAAEAAVCTTTLDTQAEQLKTLQETLSKLEASMALVKQQAADAEAAAEATTVAAEAAAAEAATAAAETATATKASIAQDVEKQVKAAMEKHTSQKCSECKEFKAISCYSKTQLTKGRGARCSKCAGAAYARWQARNPSAAGACSQQQLQQQQQMMQQQQAQGGMPQKLTAETLAAAAPAMQKQMLAAAAPAMQKQMLGECLYPQICAKQPSLAGKITGMLLELDNVDVLELLQDPALLADMIDKSMSVLEKAK